MVLRMMRMVEALRTVKVLRQGEVWRKVEASRMVEALIVVKMRNSHSEDSKMETGDIGGLENISFCEKIRCICYTGKGLQKT